MSTLTAAISNTINTFLPTRVYHVSQDPDLIIHLLSPQGYLTAKYFVSSSTLTKASRVFKYIISPPSTYFLPPCKILYKGRLMKLVELREDDESALFLIFRLLHGYEDFISDVEVPWETVYEIAVIVDKYFITLSDHISITHWVDKFKKYLKEEGFEEWVFMGRVFGIDEGYKELVARLVVEVGIYKKGDKGFLRNGKLVGWERWPDFVIEHIKAERLRLTLHLLELLHTHRTRLKTSLTCTCSRPSYQKSHNTLMAEIHSFFTTTASSRHTKNRDLGDIPWNSIVELQQILARMGLHLDRDIRQTKMLLEHLDIYDVCEVEEVLLRLVYEFEEIVKEVRGVDIYGNVVEVKISEVMDSVHTMVGKEWKRARNERWEREGREGFIEGLWITLVIVMLGIGISWVVTAWISKDLWFLSG